MVEKVISLICEEFGYDEHAISADTELDEIIGDGVELEEIIHAVEGEFYVELGEELSGETTIGQIAEMIE